VLAVSVLLPAIAVTAALAGPGGAGHRSRRDAAARRRAVREGAPVGLWGYSQGGGGIGSAAGHRGVRTQYTVVPLTEHVLAGDAGAAGAVTWLAARFAGLPAPSNC
jgi:hypothetical protein